MITTYIRRALKYFLQITFIFVVIIAILMLTGMVSKDVAVAFRNGWTSLGYIAIAFGVMSAAYPYFGYGKRKVTVAGDPAEHWAAIEEAMKLRGYVQEVSPEGQRSYHLASPVSRLARLWEDRITITPVLGGFEAEGLVRDLARVVSTLNYKLHYND